MKKHIILTMGFIYLFASCSNEKKEWQACEQKGTLSAYEEFLVKHSSGKFADQAWKMREEILALRADDFRSSKTIRVQFEQQLYQSADSESEKVDAFLPCLEIANRIAGYAGLTVVTDEPADVQCWIQLTGFKRGPGNITIPNYYHPGPLLFGMILLATEKTGYYRSCLGVEGQNETPSRYPDILDRNLGSAFYFGDYIPRLLEVFAEYYGPVVLRGALHDENIWVRGWAAFVVGGCGEESFRSARREDIDQQADEKYVRRILTMMQDAPSGWGVSRTYSPDVAWVKSPAGNHLTKGAGFDLKDQQLDAWKRLLDLPELSITQLNYFKPVHLSENRKAFCSMTTPFLIQNLEAEDWWVRKTSATALGFIHSQEAVPVLIVRLQTDPNYLVKWRAAQALGNIGDISAIDALREAEQKGNVFAEDAIKKLLDKQAAGGN